MNPHDKMMLINALERALEYARDMETTRACSDCRNFDVTGMRCKLWDAQPPQEVLDAGCDDYLFDPNSPPF